MKQKAVAQCLAAAFLSAAASHGQHNFFRIRIPIAHQTSTVGSVFTKSKNQILPLGISRFQVLVNQ